MSSETFVVKSFIRSDAGKESPTVFDKSLIDDKISFKLSGTPEALRWASGLIGNFGIVVSDSRGDWLVVKQEVTTKVDGDLIYEIGISGYLYPV